MQLGALLEDLTVAKARAGIEKLVHLTPRTARVLTQAGEEILPAEQVQVGDLLRVLPGEAVPVDGVVVSGETSIDQAVMTGEPLPVDKGPGDEVSSGTVNQFGSFDMRATKVGEDSSIQRMIRLVQSADAGKAKIVGLADRWATWIVIIALAAAALTGLVTRDLIRSVTILVVFCPCALVLATPTAIMAAIGNATRHGLLVREGDALERLAKISLVAFDKTGTLTLGVPQVSAVESFLPGVSRGPALYLGGRGGAALGAPLGQSSGPLLPGGAPGRPPGGGGLPDAPRPRGPGHGGGPGPPGREPGPHGGTGRPPRPRGPPYRRSPPGGGLYGHLHRRGRGAGGLPGPLRHPPARRAETVRGIRQAGAVPVLLTGDHENAARRIAAQVGIQSLRAGCLPEDKLSWIDGEQQAGRLVCMVGGRSERRPRPEEGPGGRGHGGRGAAISPWTPPTSPW